MFEYRIARYNEDNGELVYACFSNDQESTLPTWSRSAYEDCSIFSDALTAEYTCVRLYEVHGLRTHLVGIYEISEDMDSNV
jgi:hypothetical protein